jgi:pimeloyl-ACP methyl ester carboxylesterase
MKKTLALHGVGSSSDILRVQLAAVIKDLQHQYEFTFFDGAFTRERGPGMAMHYSGPFYTYTAGYSPAEIRVALDDLDDLIQDCGPFDGVIGFSQGASMAVSYILDHQARLPDDSSPFGFAVVLSSVAAFSPDAKYCLPTVQRLVQENYNAVREFPDHIFAKLSRPEKLFTEYLASTFKIAWRIGATTPDYDIAFFKHRNHAKVPRILHSALTQARIGIPTVHFTGERDHSEMIEQSLVIVGLCDPKIARWYQHSGGHAVLSKPQEVDRLVQAIEWAAMESSSQLALKTASKSNARSTL